MEYYRCGQIMTTHGIKGEVKIKPLTSFARFEKGSRLYISHKGQMVQVNVHHSSNAKKYYIVGFEEYNNINDVAIFHLDEIFISDEDRQDDLEDDEFYYSDLIGLEVENTDGVSRGVVVEVKELPQCDYLYVNYNRKNYYIPFIDEFICEVNDKIIIKEKEGLFNEN